MLVLANVQPQTLKPNYTIMNMWKKNIGQLLSSPNPGSVMVAMLAAHPHDAPIFLAHAPRIPGGPYPWHTGSVLEHIARCMDRVAGNPMAVWMAMCHDAGKLTTPRRILPHHYGHELRGEKIVPVWVRQLGMGQAYLLAGSLASRMHMRAANYPNLRPGKKLAIHQELLRHSLAEPFWQLVNADTGTQLGNACFLHTKAVAEWQKNGIPDTEQILLLKELPL